MAQDATLPLPGDVLAGKYRIERLIGRGGMGAVFAAQHMLLNQRVALKLLLGELADSQEASRALHERGASRGADPGGACRARARHRAAPERRAVHGARVPRGRGPRGHPQQRGPLPVAEVADYALQALDALAQAHAAGIVHRDLKPANLFLARRHDGTSLVKVLDFGIPKNLASAGAAGDDARRAPLLGSPEYMSPEQLRTPRGVDARTDIWSLGVILYELLTGRMPFTGESLGELFMQILGGGPRSGALPPSRRAARARDGRDRAA